MVAAEQVVVIQAAVIPAVAEPALKKRMVSEDVVAAPADTRAQGLRAWSMGHGAWSMEHALDGEFRFLSNRQGDKPARRNGVKEWRDGDKESLSA